MGLHDRIRGENGDAANEEQPTALAAGGAAIGEAPKPDQPADPYAELKTRVHHACIAKLGPHLFTTETNENLNERVLREVTEQLALDRTPLTREERRRIVREITDDILGYGPLDPLLRDDSVTEVMVNACDQIYIERDGKIERSTASFADNGHLLRIIDKIVSQVGRRIDEASPMVDARLPDGSRVNAIIPPLSLSGPLVTIRKFTQNKLALSDFVRLGTLTPEAIGFLNRCIQAELNILVSGGTGSDLPVRAIRQQVASALDLIIHLERLQDGTRRVTQITEVQRMEVDVITLQDIYEFKVDGVSHGKVNGRLVPTGLRPSFVHKF